MFFFDVRSFKIDYNILDQLNQSKNIVIGALPPYVRGAGSSQVGRADLLSVARTSDLTTAFLLCRRHSVEDLRSSDLVSF